MAGFRQTIARSLDLQALLLIFALTLLFLLLGAAWEIYSGRGEALRELARRITAMDALLRQSVEKPLHGGDDPGTTAQFALLRQNFPAVDLSIADSNEKITYSTRPEGIRADLESLYPAEVLEACRLALNGTINGQFPAGATSNGQSPAGGGIEARITDGGIAGAQTPQGRIIRAGDGRRKFLLAFPIANEPRCYHCHGWNRPVLGALLALHDVEEDLRGLFGDNLSRIGTAILLAALFSLLLFACLRRRFILPVQTLADHSSGIVAGNFSAGFLIDAEDELGRLSGNIGKMLGGLKSLGFARSVLEDMSVPGVMCDSQGKISLINAHLLDLLEQDGETGAYLGQDIEMLLYGRHLSASVFSRMLRERSGSLRGLEDLRTKSGALRRARLDASLVHSPEGEFLGVFATVSDLTEICRREDAVLAQSAALGQAAARAAELLRVLDTSVSLLIGQIGHTRELSGQQRKLADQTAQALAQTKSGLDSLGERAGQLAGLTRKTSRDAGQEAELARRMVISMKQLVEISLTLKERMRSLSQKTDNIAQVMQMVQEIAGESNLLALNAAVEADKAGEAGHSVVRLAGELRKLAEKTIQAITLVSTQAVDFQAGLRSGWLAVESTAASVDSCAGLVLKVEEVLCALLESVKTGDALTCSLAVQAQERRVACASLGDLVDDNRALVGKVLLALEASEEAAQRCSELMRRLELALEGEPE